MSCDFLDPLPSGSHCNIYMGQLSVKAVGNVESIFDMIIETIKDIMDDGLLLSDDNPAINRVRWLGVSLGDFTYEGDKDDGDGPKSPFFDPWGSVANNDGGKDSLISSNGNSFFVPEKENDEGGNSYSGNSGSTIGAQDAMGGRPISGNDGASSQVLSSSGKSAESQGVNVNNNNEIKDLEEKLTIVTLMQVFPPQKMNKPRTETMTMGMMTWLVGSIKTMEIRIRTVATMYQVKMTNQT